MLELVSSGAGPPTAVVRGVHLHSKYDPRAEAERYVAGALGETAPSLVVLLGAGLGYLVEALFHRIPGVQVLPVFYDEALHTAAVERGALDPRDGNLPSDAAAQVAQVAQGSPGSRTRPAWHPGMPSALLAHLRGQIGELDSEGLAVLEWPACARLYPEISRQANDALRQLLRELRGSLATTSAFGRRWLKNAFRNFVFLEHLIPAPPAPAAPVVLAASGPSLEEALPTLAAYRDRFCLWALPSSLLALREQGLRPDLVVLTDPGYYAAVHLYAGAGMGLEIAMPLSAACGTWRVGAAVHPLSQGTFFERALWELQGLAPPVLPSFGTVAATALTLARLLGAEEILTVGLDLCHRDIRSHARPNVFDWFLQRDCGRLSPFLHRSFARVASQRNEHPVEGRGPSPASRSTLALETYAGWFAGLQAGPDLRLYRLLPSQVSLPVFTNLDLPGFRAYAEQLPHGPSGAAGPAGQSRGASRAAQASPSWSAPALRASRAADLLASWARELDRADRRLRTGDLRAVLSDPLIPSLCYYVDAAALAEVRRRLRLAGPGEAADRLRRLLRIGGDFLDALRATLREE